MFSRRTSSRTRKSRDRMLHLKVSSPRIVFFDCLKFIARFCKLGVALVIMVGVGIGLGFGWQKLFVENEEFIINDVPLTLKDGGEPRFLTHSRLEEKTTLDLDQTIFAIDTDELRAAIEALPEVKSARVSRRLPDQLKVTIEEREPVAWLACRSLGIPERDREKGFLVDRDGVPFRCDSDKLWEFGEQLPVVLVPQAEDGEIEEGRTLEHNGLRHALKLVMLTSEMLDLTEHPAWVVVKDEIMLEMKTRANTLATLSYYDQKRQVENLGKLADFARGKGRKLAQVNLIPERYVPVHYH